MKKIPLRYFCFLAICLNIVLFSIKQFEQSISAQISGCPLQATDPNTGVPVYGWQRVANQTTSVKYFIDTNAFDDFQKGKLREAFAKWNTASLTTCLKINFTETQTESQAKLAIYATTDGSSRTDYVDIDEKTNVLQKAFITINKTEFINNGPTYGTAWLKV